MNDLLKDIETFKGKIENANQLIDESKRLVDLLGIAVEKVVIFDKTAVDLEEKYQNINRINDEKYNQLLKEQNSFLSDWKIELNNDFKTLEDKLDKKIKLISTLFYITVGLIVLSTLIIKLM